jgi:ATP-dependent DNA ligase
VTPYTPEQEEMLKGVDYFVHDVLTFQEVYNGYSPVKQRDRRKRVEALHPRVARATGMLIHDLVEENIFFNEAMAHNCEGIVLKNPSADYEAGHKGWRTMKRVRDLHVDLKCLAVETGKGKRTGQIARMQFKYKGKTFWADLGAGWTDAKRIALTYEWIAQNIHSPIGKVFHLSALQESSKGSLRLPKVNEMRIDKEVEDVT